MGSPEPRRYVLTSNLSVSGVNDVAIEIAAPDVTVDMNGFRIAGPGLAGNGDGIVCLAGAEGATITNGTIRGMGRHGLNCRDVERVSVTGVRAVSNLQTGIRVGAKSSIRHSTALLNGTQGLDAGIDSLIEENIANRNTGTGILVVGAGENGEARVESNVAYLNGGDGIRTGYGCVIVGNAASENGGAGINARTFFGFGVANIRDNAVANNGGRGISAGTASTVVGNAAYSNGGDGIFAGIGSTVLANTARANTGFGLNLEAKVGYGQNTVSTNTAGQVTGSGVQIGCNAVTP